MMPKPKPKPKSAMVLAKTPAPKIKPREPINCKHEPLKSFVAWGQYHKVKNAITLLTMDGITLRQIWAVVDHLVEVKAGRQTEVNYATPTEVKPARTAEGIRAGNRLSG